MGSFGRGVKSVEHVDLSIPDGNTYADATLINPIGDKYRIRWAGQRFISADSNTARNSQFTLEKIDSTTIRAQRGAGVGLANVNFSVEVPY